MYELLDRVRDAMEDDSEYVWQVGYMCSIMSMSIWVIILSIKSLDLIREHMTH